MTSQSRRERAFSDRALSMPVGASQYTGVGERTSSAPAGTLYKLDNGRRPSAGTKVGHTLVEEDESEPKMSANAGALRPSHSRRSDEVRPGDP